MNPDLSLKSIRAVLIRQEETIVFGLIERAQFMRNGIIYKPGSFGAEVGADCLVGYLLHETERVHARMRRYTSPDEHPFYRDLPGPLLPAVANYENPLIECEINVNSEVFGVYRDEIVPAVCRGGDDGNYGSSSVCDVMCLQALSRRVHYGKFVAESKYRAGTSDIGEAALSGDRNRLMELVTDLAVERDVISRVRQKAELYGRLEVGASAVPRIDPDVVAGLYERWIIPMNKRVQVEYLLARAKSAVS